MSRYFVVPLVFLLAGPAIADGLSYNYIQGSYEEVELDISGGPDADGDGYGISGSFEVGESFYVFADYTKADFDFGVDADELFAGVGYHFGVSDNVDLFTNLSWVRAEVDAPGFGSVDDDGFGVAVGLRGNVSDLIELVGSVNYTDLGDGGDTTAIAGGVWFNVTDNFALGVEASFDDDLTTYSAAARLYFGR